MKLRADAPGGPTVTGRLVGTLEAADGLVVFVEPEGSSRDQRLTVHYHHIVSLNAS